MDAIETLCRHVVDTRYEDLPPAAIASAKTFIADSLGVGVAGSRGPLVEELIESQRGLGESDDARVWARDVRLGAPGVAMVNACQIHNSEFDCVHEQAVLHPMAVLLGAVFAYVDRARRRDGRAIDGRELIVAVAVGVDVACHLGVASLAPLRFFRPATGGAFAATAALGRLAGLDADRLVGAMGITHGQLCGTMQAHTEGSPLLAMQVGFNARNAVVSLDMASCGIPGPRQVVEGQFGYLNLFEGEHRLAEILPEVGRTWRIAEIAHKPFPSGRATHGIVDACLELQREHHFAPEQIASIEGTVPPLTHRLVGRPVHDDMPTHYARLCGAYVAARALIADGLGIEDFADQARRDPATLALAARIRIAADDNPDPNALTPVSVAIELRDGTVYQRTLDIIYGNPAKPMTREAHLDKLRRNLAVSATPLAADAYDRVVELTDALESVDGVASLVDAVVPPA